MSISCTIEFIESPSKVYYSGQVLSGQIFLTEANQQKIKGIYVLISGIGYCRWSRSSKTFTGEENYLEKRIYVLGDGKGELDFGPGRYTYTFECTLPPELPSSLQGKFGSIQYTVSVVISRSLETDTIFDEPFTVIKALNLNNDPLLRNPVTFEKEETFFLSCLLCCWQLQPLKITGSLPVTGFTSGQQINFIVSLNNSHAHLNGILAQLIQEISYHTLNSGDKKCETVIIDEKKIKQIDDTEIKIDFDIPPLPPSDLTASSVCKVSYFVRVIGLTGWCHSDPMLRIPITIGTYPMKTNTVSTFNEMVTNGLQDTTNVGVISKPASPEPNESEVDPKTDINSLPYPESDPPVLKEDHAIENENENDTEFHPKYPVYYRDTPYTNNQS